MVSLLPEAAAQRELARRLDRLFDSVRPDGLDGRRYTNNEVAEAIREASPGVRVTGAYLSALRKGTKRNPSTELLLALARHFRVSASYFLDDTPGEAEIALAQVANNHGVRNLAFRALELSPEGLAAISQIVESVLREKQRPTRHEPLEHPEGG
jgi:transcriptional regulator with XRE-family HTH domain